MTCDDPIRGRVNVRPSDMTVRCVLVLMGLMVPMVVLAQSVTRHMPVVDYRSAVPRSMAVVDDVIYVSYDGGSVCRFSMDFELQAVEADLDAYYIDAVMEFSSTIWAVALDGTLLCRTTNKGPWRDLGVIDCEPFLHGLDSMFVSRNGTVCLLERTGDEWGFTTLGAMPDGHADLEALAVRNGVVVFSRRHDSTVYVGMLNDTVVSSSGVGTNVLRFHELPDGSFAMDFSFGSYVAVIVRNLLHLEMIPLMAGGEPLRLHSVSDVVRNGQRQVIGTFDVFNSGPHEGVYAWLGAGVQERLIHLDSTAYVWSRHNDDWIGASKLRMWRVDANNSVQRHDWFGTEEDIFHGGYGFVEDGTPVATAVIGEIGNRRNVVMPTSNESGSSETLEELALGEGDNYIIRSYRRFHDGREVAFTDRATFARDMDSSWKKVATNGDVSWHRIEHLTNDIILIRSEWRKIIITVDGGRSWRTCIIPNLQNYIWDAASDGEYLYMMAGGNICRVDLDSLADTLTARTANIPQFFRGAMHAVSATHATAVIPRSFTDPTFNPIKVTHFVYYTWDVNAGTVDSVALALDSPISMSLLHFLSRGDTTFVWSAEDSRLVTFTMEGIVFDTVISFPKSRSFSDVGSQTAYISADGTWWFIHEGRNIAYVLDPTRKNVVSALDDEPSSHGKPATLSITLTPNPATDLARITISSSSAMLPPFHRLVITDAQGQVVRTLTHLVRPLPASSHEVDLMIDVGGLAGGVYFLVLEGKGEEAVSKMVVSQ